MARIAGVEMPKGKGIKVALTNIYGIGHSSAQKILEKAGVEFNKKTDDLTDEELTKIREIIDREYKVCLLYTSPSPRDLSTSRMPSSA